MEHLNRLLICVTALGFFGCSTPPAKFNAEQARPVKVVAVVGFTSLNQVPDPFEDVAPKMGMAVPTVNTFAKMTEHADKQLKTLSAALGKEMGWRVLTPEQVYSQNVYQSLYSDMMTNWKNTRTPNPLYQIHFAQKVLPISQSDLFTQDVRDNMMEKLKVDALIMVQVKSSIVKPKFSIGSLGIGGQHTKSEIILKVYRRGFSEAIWIDENSEGPESEEMLTLGWSRWNISMEPKLFSFYEKSAVDAQKSLFDRRTGKTSSK